MRDVKSSFDNRHKAPQPAAGSGTAEVAALRAELASLRAELAQGRAEIAQLTESAASDREMMQGQIGEAAQRIVSELSISTDITAVRSEIAQLTAGVQQLATLVTKPTVKSVTVDRAADGSMRGATITETRE